MNKKLLRSKIALYGDTQQTLADAIGISVQRLNAKINGTGGAVFTQTEIEKIKERYNLTPEEVTEIFFTARVSNLDTE